MPERPGIRVADLLSRLAREGIAGEGVGDVSLAIEGVAPSDAARPHHLTFLRAESHAKRWLGGSPDRVAAIVALPLRAALFPGDRPPPPGCALVFVPDADEALSVALEMLAPAGPAPTPGVHPSCVVDPSARIDPGASVGPSCTIGAGAAIAGGAHLVAQVFVGAGASVGAGSTLHPGCRVLDRCAIGARCILHAGVVIGADGFGYRATPRGPAKVPHIGNVVVEDDVEIGANSCVDRGKFASTTIGRGTKIDNLVQIAHNCRVGRACIICGSSSLAGSVVLGDGVVLAGRVGVADNVTIGDRAQVAAASGVAADVPPGATYAGSPARPVSEWRRSVASFYRLPKVLADLKRAQGHAGDV